MCASDVVSSFASLFTYYFPVPLISCILFHFLLPLLAPTGKYPCLKAELVLKKTKKTAPSPASVSGGCPSELVVNFNDVPVADKHELNIDISNVSSVSCSTAICRSVCTSLGGVYITRGCVHH